MSQNFLKARLQESDICIAVMRTPVFKCHSTSIFNVAAPPLASVDGGWSEWSLFDRCTARCGGGMQKRFRQCDQPEPENEGRPCIGNADEWRVCNTHLCQGALNLHFEHCKSYSSESLCSVKV